MVTRTRASRDFEVLPFGPVSRSDPSAPREGEYTDYLVIDATKKLDYPFVKVYGGHWAPVSMPPKKIMDLVGLKWKRMVKEETVDEEEIKALAKELDERKKEWDAWRNEAYVLSEEEQEREKTRSHPKVITED